MPIDAVVFDIGRVLIDWQPEKFYDRAIGPDRRRALFDAVDLYRMNDGVDLGADFAESVEALAAAHPDWAAEIRLWRSHWIEMAQPEIPGSVRVLRALKARGVPVYALTNFGAETFQTACAAYPFLDLFDRRFVSAHLRVMKPAPGIYEILEAETGHPPERLIFTDDKAENVDAAAARGWHTHLFTGPEGWAARLREAGLLTEKEGAPHG
ncbi:2-haloacid dehalogenase [Rhodovulum bhavnagarense]|uniref:2-haloacid dehalogenase n=1 Tax=Rhodovulum bhavnagarense TaxID=992286 RepID=A0A4R2RMH6_9RHOB|nr:HAD family phosphatase [Rhodovulum bhavnagarense]TCP60951.1 2-haloacid dehalogenase [Rhodovulum bhavnagarense]